MSFSPVSLGRSSVGSFLPAAQKCPDCAKQSVQLFSAGPLSATPERLYWLCTNAKCAKWVRWDDPSETRRCHCGFPVYTGILGVPNRRGSVMDTFTGQANDDAPTIKDGDIKDYGKEYVCCPRAVSNSIVATFGNGKTRLHGWTPVATLQVSLQILRDIPHLFPIPADVLMTFMPSTHRFHVWHWGLMVLSVFGEF